MNNPPIQRIKLFEPSECCLIYEKLSKSASLDKEDLSFKIVGEPLYINNIYNKKLNLKNIQKHNLFMKTYFSGELRAIAKHISRFLNSEIILIDELPFPGFHIIETPPGIGGPTNFHIDNDLNLISQLINVEGFDTNFYFPFTIQLHIDENLIAGIYYMQPGNQLVAEQYLSLPHNKCLALSRVFKYSPGELNIHTKRIPHNVYSNNLSDASKLRVTMQGCVIKRYQQYVMCW